MANLGDVEKPNPLLSVLGSGTLNPLLPSQSGPQGINNVLSGFLGGLGSNLEITKRREYFVNQRIALDGVFFELCRFDDCILTTTTGDIHLKQCVVGPGTTLELGGKLISVAKLLTLFAKFPNRWFPTFTPLGNNVYAVSIP